MTSCIKRILIRIESCAFDAWQFRQIYLLLNVLKELPELLRQLANFMEAAIRTYTARTFDRLEGLERLFPCIFRASL